MSLTEDFNLQGLLETADPRIQEIIQKNTLALPSPESISDNTKILLDWFCTPYLAFFDEKIGFSNVPSKLWPGSDESEILLTKLLEIAPGLTEYQNVDSQKKEATGLFERIKRRFWNKNLGRKKENNTSEGT